MLDVLNKLAPGICGQYFPDGQACALPLEPGHYGGDNDSDALTFTLPDIPGAIIPILKGDLEIKVHMKTPEGNEFGCLRLLLSLSD